jgi:hypothetical protein
MVCYKQILQTYSGLIFGLINTLQKKKVLQKTSGV